MKSQCFHCGKEGEWTLEPSCWPECVLKKWPCKLCKEWMLIRVIEWNKIHGLKPNGDPPGQVVTKRDLWEAYQSKDKK